MLGMGADVPVSGRHPTAERRFDLATLRAALDPAAVALRFLLVGRVSDDDGDLLVPLDCIGVFPGLPDRGQHRRELRLGGIGIAERIRDVQARLREVPTRPGSYAH